MIDVTHKRHWLAGCGFAQSDIEYLISCMEACNNVELEEGLHRTTVLEASQNKALTAAYKVAFKNFRKNLKSANKFIKSKDYESAHEVVQDSIVDLMTMTKEVDKMSLDESGVTDKQCANNFMKLIGQISAMIGAIFSALEPSTKEFVVDEFKLLKKVLMGLPKSIDPDADFVALKKQILAVFDEMTATMSSLDSKIDALQAQDAEEIMNKESVSFEHAGNSIQHVKWIVIPKVSVNNIDFGVTREELNANLNQTSAEGYEGECRPTFKDGKLAAITLFGQTVVCEDVTVIPAKWNDIKFLAHDFEQYNGRHYVSKDRAMMFTVNPGGDVVSATFGTTGYFDNYTTYPIKESSESVGSTIGPMLPQVVMDFDDDDNLFELGRIEPEEVATEAYFGQSKTLKEIENTIGEIIEAIHENPDADFVNHPLNQKLGKLFCKQFGFASAMIHWTFGAPFKPNPLKSMNVGGYTWPSVEIVFGGRNVVAIDYKNGYYDQKHLNHLYVVVDTHIILISKLTARQVLAVILHEIGHNFDQSPYMIFEQLYILAQLAYYTGVSIQSGDPELIAQMAQQLALAGTYLTGPGHKVMGYLAKAYDIVMHYFPIVAKVEYQAKRIITEIQYVLSKYVGSVYTIQFICQIIRLLPQVAEITVRNMLLAFPTRKGEEFADSFATAYGYGPDLASALATIQYEVASRTQTKYTGIFADLQVLHMDLFLIISGNDHGLVVDRAKDCARQLKRDISSNSYPPAMKKEMQRQVAEIEKTISDWENMPDMHTPISAAFHRFVSQAFDGHTDLLAAIFPPNEVSKESVYDDRFVDIYDESGDLVCDCIICQEGFLDDLKKRVVAMSPIKKKTLNVNKVTKACNAYAKKVSAQQRMQLMALKDGAEAKASSAYRKCQKEVVVAEKNLRAMMDKFTPQEKTEFTKFCKDFDAQMKDKFAALAKDIKEAKTHLASAVKKESVDFNEAPLVVYEALQDDYKKLQVQFKRDQFEIRVSVSRIKKYIKKKKFNAARDELARLKRILEADKKIAIELMRFAEDGTGDWDTQLFRTIIHYVALFLDLIVAVCGFWPAQVMAALGIASIVDDVAREKTGLSDASSWTTVKYVALKKRILRYYDKMSDVVAELEKKCNESEFAVKESTDDYYALEAAKIDQAMQDIIDKLNDKGYKTKYSSSGHNGLKWKKGIKRYESSVSKLYNDARIMFDGNFKFPEAPEHWKWRTVDGNDYLDIIEVKFNPADGSPSEAFQAYKKKYMTTLKTWVDNLPDAEKQMTTESTGSSIYETSNFLRMLME